jgi:hypothetical protein
VESRKNAGMQFAGYISNQTAKGCQFGAIIDSTRPTGCQTYVVLASATPQGNEFLFNYVTHVRRDGYLVDDYLNNAYLEQTSTQWGLLRSQISTYVDATRASGTQFYAVIDESRSIAAQTYVILSRITPLAFQIETIVGQDVTLASQFNAIVEAEKLAGIQFNGQIFLKSPYGTQFDSVHAQALCTSFRSVLYNTNRLRILWEFASRGTTSSSWTANTTAPGEFSASNLNTDVVEQVWRSNGDKSGIKLVCDTGLSQGTFMDTLAILNHNFSSSAQVVIEGDDDPLFGSPGFTYTFSEIERNNLYYIAPTLPLNGYRYWRISVDDPTNSAAYIQVGTILFGQATIWAGESFKNPLQYKRTHYTDKVFTEGFTNVSNDRGIKKQIALEFESIDFNGGNYANLQDMIDTIRTSHKALWIPTPQYASRYAVFGKLSEIPQETHNDLGERADYVAFNVEIDEAK